MDSRTGFMDFNGSGKDLIELYEPRTSGPTGTTHYVSHTYGKDLGSIFIMNASLGGLGLVGTIGANCGYKLINGTDLGSLFCNKGSVGIATKSLQFTYTSNMFATGTNSAYFTKTSVSVEAWIKIPSGSIQGGDVNNAPNSSNYGTIVLKQAWFGILVDRTNNLMVFYSNSAIYPNNLTNLFVGDGNWHHVAVSLAPGTDSSAIYLDGIKKTNFTWITYGSGNVDLIIGNNVYYGGNYRAPFVGKISFVRIWDTNLSDLFIANNYKKYLNPSSYSNLIAFYPMNEGSGTVLNNLAVGASAYSLNITGGPTWTTDQPLSIAP